MTEFYEVFAIRSSAIFRDEVVYRRIQQSSYSDRMFDVTRWRTTTIRASPSYQGSQPPGFAPSWPEAACSRPGFLHGYLPMCQEGAFWKKFRRGRCPGYGHRPTTTNATTTTTAATNAASNVATNTNGILAGF
jgi:hypothetical protein